MSMGLLLLSESMVMLMILNLPLESFLKLNSHLLVVMPAAAKSPCWSKMVIAVNSALASCGSVEVTSIDLI